ncbi:MAG: 1-acyl-sn-glycerol-3-phosphate acyltransferase, partial [Nitrospinota bacterium]
WKARPLVIPTAVLGTNEILPKGSLLPRLFKRAEVRFGEPLELEDCYSMEGGRETSLLITRRVMEAIAALMGERAGELYKEEAARA